ncbi:MAG: lipoyl synthase [Verrucomicrobia bacterium]|nr:lipoyl synthase [Verrucomicrobiota bacterium]MCF7708025.1 lipoyl synthase [Verrucomicrobiota bacterium]
MEKTGSRGGRLPEWLRLRPGVKKSYGATRRVLRDLNLHTVCESAKCPNHGECWGKGTATFMICGDRCTRACRFCAVESGEPLPLDPTEPRRVAMAAERMRLRHVVITSVTRDDLEDGAAGHFKATLEALRELLPCGVLEVLTPDFDGREKDIMTVLSGGPNIFNHNLETVRRLTPEVRSKSDYDRSLGVLRTAKVLSGGGVYTKSGLMLGLGETEAEVLEAMSELRGVGCDVLTLGQYLRPAKENMAVEEYIEPAWFDYYGEAARGMGFVHVASGPLVRSSYNAAEFDIQRGD